MWLLLRLSRKKKSELWDKLRNLMLPYFFTVMFSQQKLFFAFYLHFYHTFSMFFLNDFLNLLKQTDKGSVCPHAFGCVVPLLTHLLEWALFLWVLSSCMFFFTDGWQSPQQSTAQTAQTWDQTLRPGQREDLHPSLINKALTLPSFIYFPLKLKYLQMLFII